MFTHCNQLVATEGLQQGDTVSYDTECDNREGKCNAVSRTVTSSSGGWSGVDVPVPQPQQKIEKAVHLTPQEFEENRTEVQVGDVASPPSRERIVDVPARQAHDATVDAIMPCPRTREFEAEAEALQAKIWVVGSSARLLNDTLCHARSCTAQWRGEEEGERGGATPSWSSVVPVLAALFPFCVFCVASSRW